jgi:hypothetical protein
MDEFVRESLTDLILEIPSAVSYWGAVDGGLSDDSVPRYRIVDKDDQTMKVDVTVESLYRWCLSDGPKTMWLQAGDPYQIQALKDLHLMEWGDIDWDVETVDLVVQGMLFREIVYG